MNRRKYREELIRIHDESIQLRKDEFIQRDDFAEIREKEYRLAKKRYEIEQYRVSFNDDLLKENMTKIYKACVAKEKEKKLLNI